MSEYKGGWIKLWRPITGHWLWKATKDKPFSQGQAWIDLILLVNHHDTTISYGGKPYLIKRGSTITSMQKLADRWCWSRSKVDRYIKRLSDDSMITIKRKENGTLLTVENYGFFQGERATDEQPAVNRRLTGEQPTNTNKNIKNDKNDYYNPPLSSPPLSEILRLSGYERLEDDDEKNYFKRAIESLWNTKSRSVDGKKLSEADIKHYLESISFDIIQTISDRVNFYDIKNPVNYLKTALLKELVGNVDTSSQSGNNKLNYFGDTDYDSLDKKVVEKMINRAKKQ